MRVPDEEFLDVEPLVLERELTIQISQLIVHSVKGLGDQAPPLQSKRRRVREINLECEVELRRFSWKMERFHLPDQNLEKGLLRFLLRTSSRLGSLSDDESCGINQCTGRL